MGQAANRVDRKEVRSRSKQRQKNMQKLMWVTGGVLIIALIVAVAFLKPADKQADPNSFDFNAMATLGSKDAKVKIVEFGDFKCPACQVFSQDVEPQLKAEYIDKGLVSLSFMNYPFIGPDSRTAALAGLSVYHQNNDAFWKYYDALYKNQPNESEIWATPDYLVQLAQSEKLDIDFDKLRSDIENETYADQLSDQMSRVKPLGVTGTPTLFVNGTKVGGADAMKYDAVKAAVDKALAAVEEAGK
ncbi:DSBA oxidoreductase [Paenibacillus curdlanolyticus YK9]|uniref:DSBA oxidoreductase n=1 Tax=Paenibacillus curdlanolyticus YK9 TaxID=717606 RepID=E0I9V7_9BACL|nr:thioredoxin domain-containing protein [Paenibacillus curdlanolyticus]EFM10534.1 DSBA oxidoreductase [Paenibacillus curdlanolyticus YK9]